jgi:ATP-dependent helicase/nuclease subunit A
MPVRVSGTGWWTSPLVQAARFALSVAANPADKHANLCFATLGPPNLPLESCLARLVAGEQIEAPELARLRALWPDCLGKPITALVNDVIAAADLREWAERQGDPKQARADLLRFEAEAAEFLDSHRDMRAAAGLHGEGAQVFLGWLAGRIGDREFDARPDPSGGTAEGIEVATWHAAKGREWPVVVVACLDHSYHPRPGGVEAHFADFTNVDRILETASLRFTPHFDAAEARDRFLDELCPEAEKTACRLLYVALTRARDALVIEWPEFQIEKTPKDEAAERTSGYLLANQCGITVSPDALVVNGKAFPARVIHCPKEMPAAFDSEPTTPLRQESAYGRNAIRREPMRDAGVPVIVQPSLMAELAAPPPAVETIILSEPLFATAGAFASATDRGTALHDAFRMLMLRPDLAARVASRTGLDGETMQTLSRQADALRAFLTDRGFPDIALEVPVVALDANGSTINAVIDCLAYGDSGLAIIDHKSDALADGTSVSPTTGRSSMPIAAPSNGAK